MAESVDSAMASSSLVLIDRMTLAGPSNTATFTDIPPSFGDLICIWSGAHDGTGNNQFVTMGVRFNGDAGENYVSARLSFDLGNSTPITNNNLSNNASVASGGMVGPENSGGWFQVPRYASGASKDVFGWGSMRDGLGTAPDDPPDPGNNSSRRFFIASGIWKNTAVVNSVRMWPSGLNFRAGATFFLFGTPK